MAQANILCRSSWQVACREDCGAPAVQITCKTRSERWGARHEQLCADDRPAKAMDRERPPGAALSGGSGMPH